MRIAWRTTTTITIMKVWIKSIFHIAFRLKTFYGIILIIACTQSCCQYIFPHSKLNCLCLRCLPIYDFLRLTRLRVSIDGVRLTIWYLCVSWFDAISKLSNPMHLLIAIFGINICMTCCQRYLCALRTIY